MRCKHMFGGRSGVAQAARTDPTARIMVCGKDQVYGYQHGYESVKQLLLMAWHKDAEFAINRSDSKGKKASVRVISNWQANVPVCVESLVLSGETLFMAGSPRIDRSEVLELLEEQNVDLYDADPRFRNAEDTITGRKGGVLYVAKKDDGTKLTQLELPSIPAFDGLIAADKRLYVSMRNGVVMCLSSGG